MNLYLDTSAAMKLVVEEPESAALAALLESRAADDRVLSSWLLHAELTCAAARHPDAVTTSAAAAVLDRVVLVDLLRADLLAAPVVGAGLRSQDALHLAVAVRAEVSSIITYDVEQGAAARAIGLHVLRPS